MRRAKHARHKTLSLSSHRTFSNKCWINESRVSFAFVCSVLHVHWFATETFHHLHLDRPHRRCDATHHPPAPYHRCSSPSYSWRCRESKNADAALFSPIRLRFDCHCDLYCVRVQFGSVFVSTRLHVPLSVIECFPHAFLFASQAALGTSLEIVTPCKLLERTHCRSPLGTLRRSTTTLLSTGSPTMKSPPTKSS